MHLWMMFSARVLAALLVLSVFEVNAQVSYPARPIRVIVPYAAGGSTDNLARIIGEKLSASLGQPVIVDNRPGGNTIVGTDLLAKAPADGYTIMFMDSSHVLTPLLTHTPYDPIKDFVPITTTNHQEWVLVVTPSLPAKTLTELFALAKSKPGQLNYATAGSGGVQRLMAELLAIRAGISMQNVPYKGSGEMMPDLMSGRVEMAFLTPISVIQQVKAGTLRALAITGETRSPSLPDVPTFDEAGLPPGQAGYEFVGGWYGFIAPAGTPAPVIEKLSAEIDRIIGLPDVKKLLVAQGMAPYGSTPAAFSVLMKDDMAKYQRVIKRANIKID